MSRPHKRLDAWKKGIDLTVTTYKLTGELPESEKFGLTSQMRRAAVSVPSNIAEGAARNTRKEFTQFLYTAQGSLSELDTQAIICRELGYFSENDYDRLNEIIELESKLIVGLLKYLKKRN